MGSTKLTFQKEGSVSSNYVSSKNLFQFKNLVQRIYLMYQPLTCPCSYLSKALEFYLRALYPNEYRHRCTLRSETIFDNFLTRPWKMIKSDFCFTLKAVFVLKIFKCLLWIFDHVVRYILPNILRCEGNQMVKFAKLIKYKNYFSWKIVIHRL